MSTPKDTDFSNGRDSQVGEPVASRFRYLNRDGLPITAWSASCDHPMYQHPALEIQPLYTAPPAAQINQQMLEALEAFINAWGDCLGHPDTDEERFRLSEARDKAESAVLAAATQMRGDA